MGTSMSDKEKICIKPAPSLLGDVILTRGGTANRQSPNDLFAGNLKKKEKSHRAGGGNAKGGLVR